MSESKNWLHNQMRSAKQEVSGWQGWKRDTIRKEISNRLSHDSKSTVVAIRSSTTGRFVLTERKK